MSGMATSLPRKYLSCSIRKGSISDVLCLINCSQTEQIVEEMVQRYIAGTGPKRKLGAWHRFKIRNNRPAQKSIAYLFKITQCLEVFSTLLPAVALEQYSSEKAKQALKGINDKFANRNYT